MFRNKKIILDILLIGVFCAIFAFWFFDDLDKQGLYCDVALFGNAALSVIKNVPYSVNIGELSIGIFGRKFPLMINEYNAATDIYAALPWVYLLGNKPIAMHMPGFVWGLLSIIGLYPTCLVLFRDRLYAAIVTFLFVTSPPFITASRIGSFTGTLTIFFALISVLSLFQWREKNRKIWLFIMGLSMGMGLAGRIQFLWFISSVFVFLAIQKSTYKHFVTFKNGMVFLWGFVIGALSLILGNVKGNFLTVKFIREFSLVSRGGISNLDYLHNFLERLREAISLMNGTAVSTAVMHKNWTGVCLFVIGISFIILREVYRRIKNQQAGAGTSMFPLLIFIFVLIQSPFTPTVMHVHHIIFLLPFISMISCTPCLALPELVHARKHTDNAARNVFRKLLLIAFASTTLVMLVACSIQNYQLLHTYKVHRNIHSGQELKWDVMSGVKNYLFDRKIKRIGLGDTGLLDPLLFLSDFQLDAEEIFYAGYKEISRQAGESRLVHRFIAEREGYYLFRTEDNPWVRFFPDFQKVAERCGKRVELLCEFRTPENVPVYRIYKVY